MLWSQIRLTKYDFSDLHITGEFDNRPGIGRFLRIFSCVVTYRTGGGRRLYMISSADAQPGTVRCPGGVVKNQPDTVRCPADFTQMKHISTCNYVYNNIKIRHHSSKETDGHRPICIEIFESSLLFSHIVRCPAGHRTVPERSPLKSYDLNFKPQSSGARPMCAKAGRAPYAGVILPSMTLQIAIRAPWNFK